MNPKQRQTRAFTLVEVVVASSIGAFITLVAMAALSTVSDSYARVQAHCDRISQVRYATSVITRDLRNLYRDTDRNAAKFVAETSMADEGQRLIFYTVSHSPARPGRPEADVYEVEYFVRETDGHYYLMRRWWPNPNEAAEPGGLLTMLVRGVVGFQARFFDGTKWQTEWSQRSASLPKAVEVGLIFSRNEEDTPHIERVLVHTQPRAGQQNAQNVAPAALDGFDADTNQAFDTRGTFETE